MNTAPIILFVFNRPQHTQRTVEALQANELASQSDLIIFSDGARTTEDVDRIGAVRKYVRSIDGFRSVTVNERDKNVGLAASIIEGVTRICEEHGRAIVVEDDLVTSRSFLNYMNQALDVYANEEQVASIHGYSYPVSKPLPEIFFLRGADCWGWATWQRAWSTFEQDGSVLLRKLQERQLISTFDLDGAYKFSEMLKAQIEGRNDSWAVRWHASCFLQEKLTLYPGRSLVHNIGNDASGTHCADVDDYATVVADTPVRVERIELSENVQARAAFAAFLRSRRPNLLRRTVARVAKRIGALR